MITVVHLRYPLQEGLWCTRAESGQEPGRVRCPISAQESGFVGATFPQDVRDTSSVTDIRAAGKVLRSVTPPVNTGPRSVIRSRQMTGSGRGRLETALSLRVEGRGEV
ncbi:hypothetical protein AAFF_G00253240 [Aldrovandia affinis]|uniref:Uncharacterized protein n=1 Tax=Aldrovandia affinis TaxID=143900 RepID=A0AAD7WUG0_9TELE|nr:hypothetical protein AAFF_G00253240 [Aldrovandia affinis]